MASKKVYIKTYKEFLKETVHYKVNADKINVLTYDKKGKLSEAKVFKRLSKSDTDKRWDHYEDAVKDYKKELKSYSDQYDDFKDYYGYGYSDDYGSDSKSSSSGSSKKSVDRI